MSRAAKVRLVILLWTWCKLAFFARGQTPLNYAVQVSATVQASPPQITLSWPFDSGATAYTVARKLRDTTSWGSPVSLLPGATGYVDTNNVSVGGAYEYNIEKQAATYFGAGYIYAGIALPPVVSRGKVVLVVDSSIGPSLAMELARLQQDLAGDGWTVLRHDVPRMAVDPADQSHANWAARAAELANLKALIKADYNADPANVNSVFLFGHVPVPYSGNFAPDSHSDHQGAWPADVYYADMTGAWTDSSVTATTAADPRNINVPGDGKFDAISMPANATLQVGRVDFANLPAFALSETELLRQYLYKDHGFRQKWITTPGRGLIDDNFGVYASPPNLGEAFAADGWRNFAPFFGAANTTQGDWLTTLAAQGYLWGYGCGGGTYTSSAGVADTFGLAGADPQVVFTMLFGSYYGDWDSQNNFLRAPLATPTYTLTSAWAGRPFWYFHHMAMGETIGFSTRLSQNNQFLYVSGNANTLTHYVHIALMGDPTLRMSPIAPPPALTVIPHAGGGTDLKWNPSPDAGIGYLVFGAPAISGPFTQLTTAPIPGNSYTDPGSQGVYMVRTVNLQVTSSGTYTNLSQGVFQSPTGALGAPQIVLFQPAANAQFVAPMTISFRVNAFDPANLITKVVYYANGTPIATSLTPPFNFTWNNAPAGTNSFMATATYGTGQTTNSGVVTNVVVMGPPLITSPPQDQTVPEGGGASFQVAAAGTPPLAYQWLFNGVVFPAATTSSLTLSNLAPAQAGPYSVVISNAFGVIISAVANLIVELPPTIQGQTLTETIIEGDTIKLDVSVNPDSAMPLYYQWTFNGANLPGATMNTLILTDTDSSQAGDYTVVVSNAAGSVTSAPVLLTVLVPPMITSQPMSATRAIGGNVEFQVQVATNSTPPLGYQWLFSGTNILGETDDTLVLTSLVTAQAGGYTVLITNVAGSITSSVAALSVTALMPPMVVTAPASQTVTVGARNVTFQIIVSGTGPFGYQWEFNGSNIPGATTNTLVLNDVQANQEGNYTVVVTDPNGSAISTNAMLTVQVPPTLTGPTNQMVALGSSVTMQVTASGTTPFGYQWSFNGTNLMDATSDTLLLANVTNNQSGIYTVVVTNAVGTASSNALLTVVVPPSIESQTSSVNVGKGSNTRFEVVADGTPPLMYQWFFEGTNAIPAGNNFFLDITNATTATNGEYTVEISNFAGSITSAPMSLTVEVPPIILTQPTNQTLIVGTNVSFQVVAVALPLSYQWMFNGTNLPDATSDTLSLTNVQGTNSGSYVVEVSNLASNVFSTNAILTVLVPPTLVSAPTDQTVMAGANVSFQALAMGTEPLAYIWSFGDLVLPAATNATLTLTNVQLTDAGTYTVVVTNFLGSTIGESAMLNVLVAPTISAQPISQTAIAGTNVTFQVAASGSPPLSYAWMLNGAILPGATAPALGLTNVQPGQAGSYSVVVTNAAGLIASAAANLTVLAPPTLVSQPTNQTVLAGTNVIFQVAASGTGPLSYQWAVNGTNLPGATDDLLVFTNAQPALNGAYSVTVTNVAGSASSPAALLTVLVLPIITSLSTNATVLAGTNVSFQVVASGSSPLNYQWTFNGTNMPGVTGDTLILASVQAAQSGAYAVVVTNQAGSAASLVANLTVLTPPSFVVQPTNQTVLAGVDVNFQAVGAGSSPLSYQWFFGTTNLAGATTGTLTLSNAQPAQSGNYAVVISNVVGAVASISAALAVLVPPSITVQPTNQTVMLGTNVSLQVVAAGSNPLGYQWAVNGTNLAGATGDALVLTNAQPAQNGNYTVAISNAAGTTLSVAATLAVLLPPAITVQPINQTVVTGAGASFQVAAAGSGPLSYQWTFNGASLAGSTNNTLLLSNVQSNQSGNYSMVITNLVGSVASLPATLAVLVPPTLLVQPTNQTVVLGTNASFQAVAAGSSPFSYQWFFNGTNLPGATDATLTLTNVQSAQSGVYFMMVTNLAGAAPSSNALLTVVVAPSILTQPTNETVVAGSNAVFQVIATGGEPLNYQWSFNGTNLPDATTTMLALTNAQAAQAGSYAVAITNLAGSVLSDAASLTVLLPPALTRQPASQTTLVGASVSFKVAADGTAPFGYQWLFNGTNLPGAEADALVLTNVQPVQSGAYFVMVTNAAGSATSAAANLRVLAPAKVMDIKAGANGVAISITSFAGINYALQYKNALTDIQWVSLPPVPGTGGTVVLSDAGGSSNSRFYRIVSN